MCGIGALYNPRSALSAETLRAMQAVVRHRGPDDEGVVCFRSPESVPEAYGGPDTPQDAYSLSLPYRPTRAAVETGGGSLGLTHRRPFHPDLAPSRPPPD